MVTRCQKSAFTTEISPDQRFYLSQIGDSLNLAKINSIDSVGYFDNQNLYKLIDTLGVDSVLVFSVNPDSAFYRVFFEYVGSGNGDYVLDSYNALGKVFAGSLLLLVFHRETMCLLEVS